MSDFLCGDFVPLWQIDGRGAGNRTRPTCTPCMRTADILHPDNKDKDFVKIPAEVKSFTSAPMHMYCCLLLKQS